MAITGQEAWLDRHADGRRIEVPEYMREVVEEVAFQARGERKIDKRSGVSQRMPITCLENAMSNAERRAAYRDLTEVRLPDCGHMLHHEQPDALARELERFLA